MIVDNKDPKNIQKFNQIIAQEILSQEDYDFCKAFDEGSVLPMFYHGIVKKKILDDIYNTCKTYFPGPSPDMAVSIAISLKIKEFILLI